jgi:hypothetical protein
MEAKSQIYIALIDVEGVRQGYLLSKDKGYINEIWKHIFAASCTDAVVRDVLLHEVKEIPEDANPIENPGLAAAKSLEDHDVIYVPVSITPHGMLERILPTMTGMFTTETYVRTYYPKLTFNPLLEAALICDLCIVGPAK